MTVTEATSTGSMNFVPLDYPLGKRINIVGNGGKTTLSKAVAAKTGLTCIEMDAVFWKPDWQESTAEELTAGMEQAIASAPGGWIIDGHYWSKVGDLVLRQADMVIWLDLPWKVMFWRMLRRSFQRAWDKNKICGDNTESWRQLFSTRSLWWYWVTHRKSHAQRSARLQSMLPAETPVVRLRSARDLDRIYQAHGLRRG